MTDTLPWSTAHRHAGPPGSQPSAAVRPLVPTRFSQRYSDCDPACFHDEASAVFGGDIVIAEDLNRVPLPPRRPSAE